MSFVLIFSINFFANGILVALTATPAVGSAFSGQGPTLVNEFQLYGARHFLRSEDRARLLLRDAEHDQRGDDGGLHGLGAQRVALPRSIAVDGAPTLTVPTSRGQYVVPLVRRQLKSRPNSNGSATVYGAWIVPAHPVVPHELRSAEVRVRHNSTDDEVTRGKPRTRALRPIPETDADFSRLYGVREHTESMHHHLKQRLWNGRARCVGLKRQRINLHAYQLRTGIAALIAFHYRTGESLEAWFGAWRPPPLRRTVAA